MMNLELLKTLCELPGVSGHEQAVADRLEQLARQYTDDVYRDPLGNVIARRRGEKTPPRPILFAAHMDEVGFLVNHIDEEGLLRVINVGGVYGQTLCGRQLLLPRTGARGVLGMAPSHLRKDKEKVPRLEDMYLDIGARSRKEAEEWARLGDVAVFCTQLHPLGDRAVVGKALDDRLGCAMLLELLARDDLPCDICCAFTVQEELGLRGAQTAAFAVRPAYAVILDVGGGADNAGFDAPDRIAAQGLGPIISFADGATYYDRELYEEIAGLAEKNGIPWQTKTRISGGTDAGSIQRAAGGCRVVGLSVCGRNIHTAASSVNLEDVDNTRRLLALTAGYLARLH